MSVNINETPSVTVLQNERPVIEHVTTPAPQAEVSVITDERTVLSNTMVYAPSLTGGDPAALQAHINSPTPHPAYDIDMPTLKYIFENGLT